MVRDVRGIHSDRQRLALCKTERFLDISIQEPCAERIDVSVPERSDFSGFRIHERRDDRSIRLFYAQRVECTECGYGRGYLSRIQTLGIFLGYVLVSEISSGVSVPRDASLRR